MRLMAELPTPRSGVEQAFSTPSFFDRIMAKRGRQKHIPQRTCVVCRRTFPKREVHRIVRSPQGDVYYDPSGKAQGRGAYLCNDLACWESAMTGNFLDRALKTKLTPAQRSALRKELARRKALIGQTSTNG